MKETDIAYRTDPNGTSYRYLASSNDVSKRYSLISVPTNTRRTDGTPYRILMVSDAHIGAEYGTWVTETPYRFHDGDNLHSWARTVIRLPHKMPVRFLSDTHLELNGRLCTVLKDQVLPLAADTTLAFVNEMHIALPPDTEVIFPQGITTWNRALILTDCILREWDECAFDCIFFLGDIVSNEENKWKGDPNIDFHYWSLFQKRYLSRLTNKGVPYFFVYANHDDLTDDEFAKLFPYTKNFAVTVGDTLFLAMDHFAKPNPENRRWGYGAPSGSDPDFLNAVTPLLAHAKDVYLLSHYFPLDFARTQAFIEKNSTVLAGFEGHSHHVGTRTLADGKAPFSVYVTGHFSWCGDEWGMAAPDAKNITGLPSGSFGLLCLDGIPHTKDGVDAPAAHVYHIFPEICYGSCYGSGNLRNEATLYSPFRQERYMTDTEPANSLRHHIIDRKKHNM